MKNIKILWFSLLFMPVASFAQFAPPAGQEGSTAIHVDSSVFVAWANTCVIERGCQQIDTPSLGFAYYGDDEAGIGKANNNVVSLGDGGNAILTFEEPVFNGPGPDFAVFENAFNDYSLELAFVEVSSDGVNYFRFPSVSLTPTDKQIGGFGAVDPAMIHNIAGKYRVLYGTPFDLDDIEDNPLLDKKAVTHVKIIDVVGNIDTLYATYDSEGHIVNDPWPTPFYSSGFDFDAVGVIHDVIHQSTDEITECQIKIYPNPCSDYIKIKSENRSACDIFNMMGQKIMSLILDRGDNMLNISDLQVGFYFISIKADGVSMTGKIVKR